MNVVRFPIEELSADYGDIILDSVSDDVETIISINGTEVLHEIYSPDVNGMVYIRDVGSLAMMYDQIQDINLNNGLDGSFVKLDISLKEGNETFETSVNIYRCDAESGDTLAVTTLKKMPLSRVTKKITGIGRSEFVSFYAPDEQTETGEPNDPEEINVDVIYYGNDKDELTTVTLDTLIPSTGNYYRYDVSPSVIADLCQIIEPKIISYTVYKSENESISFVLDNRAFLNKTAFIFRNIFGAQEAFTCTGDSNTERKWTRDYGNVNRKQMQISRNLEKTVTVNTGYINEETTGLLEDLLNSQSICLLEEGELRDVSIVEESFKVTSRKDQLIAVEFKYQYSSNNHLQFRTNKRRIFDYTFDETFN